MRRLSNNSGFTLIEIMVVVLILGLLAALVVPKIVGRTDDARVTKAKSDIKAIESALNLFKIDNGFYPTSAEGLAALVQAPPRAKKWNPDGYLDKLPVSDVGRFEKGLLAHLRSSDAGLLTKIRDQDQKIAGEIEGEIKAAIEGFAKTFA